ncbi:hypothetical protein OSB04_011899 [Centaurea solstitialis]|uniref:Integrase catalytic domain-containing protein n=1 Tax=Centaurea solstitialis TaxID=347529 RepID=A0AA38WLY3_9ASTR|nr:hypothetical protein OSB04_011899 [Centaurea solstitialis]
MAILCSSKMRGSLEAYRDRGMYRLSLKDHVDNSDDFDSDESMDDVSDDESVNEVSDDESIRSNAMTMEEFISGDGERSDSVSNDDKFVFGITSSKYEAFEAFKIYKVEVKNQKEKCIKILRSDRDGEYFSSEFDIFCEENGIKHERTSLFTPQ